MSLIGSADGDVRFVPSEEVSLDSFCSIAHLSRYEWFVNRFQLDGSSVLDFGCGSGYGSALIAQHAKYVKGLDISRTAIDHALVVHRSRNLAFEAADLEAPFDLESLGHQCFDFVVSFDVIEHVEKYWVFVENIRSLLAPGGIAIVGCPNRFPALDISSSWNPYHVQEFTPLQLNWLLSREFDHIEIFGQDLVDSKRFWGKVNFDHRNDSGALAPLLKALAKNLAKKYFRFNY